MVEAMKQELTILNISCACRHCTGSFIVPSSELPLPVDLCHCNTCRHVTGLLCVSVALIPRTASCLKIHGEVCGYRSSSRRKRFFCKQCGAFLCDEREGSTRTSIYTGALDKADGIVELEQHRFVTDTKDGGLSLWLRGAPAWEGQPHQSAQAEYSSMLQSDNALRDHTDPKPKLHCHCQCGGIQFFITRPNERSSSLSSPWPDLLVPYHSGSSENSGDVKWWLCANETKYLAGTCACNSCRLASGCDLQAWAFVPKNNLLQVNDEALSFGMGTLKQYKSSEGTYREFCSVCGATVFWHCDERPNLIDVSVGLLDAQSGARAETWLEWCKKRVSFEEEAQNKALILNLQAGLGEWGKKQASSTTA